MFCATQYIASIEGNARSEIKGPNFSRTEEGFFFFFTLCSLSCHFMKNILLVFKVIGN